MSNKIKILLVEHNPDDIELIQHELNNEDLDFVLQIVKREQEYISAIKTFIPDIILSDYSLPSFDGPAALKIREEIAADIPFIFVSGSIGEERSIEYIKNGVTDYVLKEKLFTLGVKIKRSIQESIDRQQKNKIANELQQRETQLQIAQQIAHVGSWELDFSTNIFIISNEASNIFGIEAGQNHLSLQTWSSMVHPEDLDAVLEKVKTSPDTLIGTSYRIIRPDGIVRHIYSESKFNLDPSGKPIGMYGIASDVTEKKLAEEKLLTISNALQAALSDLNKIMDSSLDMICTVDEEGKFVTVSSASFPILGYQPHELNNRKFIDFVFSEDVDYTIEAATDVMGGTPVTIFENRYRHKNGSVIPLLWSATWDETDKLMYCIAKDATEKKKFENALEGERQRFQELFFQAPTSMGILKGSTHIFETVNPLYLELIRKPDIIGKTVKEVLPEIESQGFIDLLDNVYQTGQTYSANETLIQLDQKGNGELTDKYLNFIYQAYKNIHGKIDGIFFFAVDVTEQVLSRKKIEESENRFRVIIEKSAEMITLSNKDGEITYASPSIIKTFGYSFEEIVQQVSTGFVHPDDVKSFAENREKIMLTEGKSFLIELRLKHKSGYWIWCEVRLTNMLHELGVNAMVSNFRDISDKKEAEMQQEFSSNNLNALINNTNDLMWSVDKNFDLITSNQPFDAMGIANFGKTIPKGDNILSMAYSAEMLNHFKQLYERAFAGESFTELEYFDHPSEIWTEISYYPIRKNNEVIGTACHSRDVTKIKKAEQQIINSNVFNRGILNSLTSHIAVVDGTGNIVAVNKIWENFALQNGGTTMLSNGIGSNYFKVCENAARSGATIAGQVLQGLKDVMDGKSATFYIEYPCHSPKEKRWFGMHVNRFESEEIMLVIAHQNITARKGAEEKLKQSEMRYRQIIETAQEGIWMIDENNKTTFVNNKLCDILEYSREEMMGATNLSFKDEREQKNALEQIERRKRGVTETHDSTYITKSGRNIWANVSTNPVLNDDGKYVGALAMITDITDRKFAEIHLKELNVNLERQTQKLAVSNEELERFAYVTSHDLQEPLRMVTSFLQLLQNKYEKQLDDTAQKYINFAVDGAARMKVLILDLLEFSRISSVVEDHTIINMNDVIIKVRHLLKPAIDECSAQINVSFLPMVCCNESQLLQLFQNLISNAIKYKAGKQPIINISYSETPEEWQFCVEDNGIGINEKFFEKIFIIFQRLHNKNEYAGTGIGLAICKKIVELHGGKIWVESVKGQGSKFYFTIQKLQRSNDNDAHILCPDIIANL